MASTQVDLYSQTDLPTSDQLHSGQISEALPGAVDSEQRWNIIGLKPQASWWFQGGPAPQVPAGITDQALAAGSWAGSFPPDAISPHGLTASSDLDWSSFCGAALVGSFHVSSPSGPRWLSSGSINICPYSDVRNEHTVVR